MDNDPQEQSSCEKQPSSSLALSRADAAANPQSTRVLPPSLGTTRTESHAVTSASHSRARVNHVSGKLIASKAEGKVAASAKPSRGNLVDRQVEHPSPHNNTAEKESYVPKKETKHDNSAAAKKRKKTQDEEMTMCNKSEPNEQAKEEKMYEIPLTKEPASKRKKQTKSKGQTSGRWTHEEHEAFLEGLKVFGREWKKVAEKIPTRTSAQIRSHAQKYFSKIAKDEGLLLHEHQQLPQVASGGAQPEGHLPVSIQRTAERIMANPTGVQMEVEDTLRQLRERYRQLQIRLEESQRARGLPPMDRIVEEQGDDDLPAGMIHRGGYAPGMDRRKRSLEEVLQQQHQEDGASSVASDLSHSLASLSPSRELDNEELIALHVLGGTLPRSASGTDLHQSRSSSFSEAEDSQVKRQRLEEESNDQAANDGNKKDEPDQDGGDQAMV
jgi:SHAQKYF class myb-like DNA-binding protein